MTITSLITYQLFNPRPPFRPLNSILAVTVTRIHLSLTMGHSTLRISSTFSLSNTNLITSRPHPTGRNQMQELRQLLILLSAYYLLRMTLAWLCTLSPQYSTRRTHLFSGSASVCFFRVFDPHTSLQDIMDFKVFPKRQQMVRVNSICLRNLILLVKILYPC